MVSLVQKAAGLGWAGDVGKRIRYLMRRNRVISMTKIRYDLKLEGGFKDIASRLETMMAVFPNLLTGTRLSWNLDLYRHSIFYAILNSIKGPLIITTVPVAS